MAPYLGLRGRPLIAAIGFLSGFCFFLFGYDQGDFGGLLTVASFRQQFPQLDTIGNPGSKHTALLQGTANAAWNLGCIISCIASIWLCNLLGRRKTIVVGLCILIAGEIIQCSSFSLGQLITGRVIAGIGNGFNTAAVPAWQAETCRAHRRGTYLMITGSCIGAGVMTAYWVSFGFAYLEPSPAAWRVPIAFQLIFALPCLLVVGFMPESPRWLILKGRADEALRVLSALNDVSSADPWVYKEFLAIKDSVLEMSSGGFRAIFTNGEARHFHRTVLAFLIQAFQQISGINLIIQYIALIMLEQQGYPGWVARLLAACLGTESLLASIVPIIGIDHFWGRRSLLIFGAVGMSASMIVITVMTWLRSSHVTSSTPDNAATLANGTTDNTGTAGTTVATIFFFVFTTFFVIGWQGMAWLYSVEIVPLRIRGPATALSTAGNWLMNFWVVLVTPIALHNIGWRTYIIFAVTNATIAPLVYLFFPEAAYRTLEEMDVIFHAASLSRRPWTTVVRDSREAPLWYGRDGKADFDYEGSEWHASQARKVRFSDEVTTDSSQGGLTSSSGGVMDEKTSPSSDDWSKNNRRSQGRSGRHSGFSADATAPLRPKASERDISSSTDGELSTSPPRERSNPPSRYDPNLDPSDSREDLRYYATAGAKSAAPNKAKRGMLVGRDSGRA